MNKFIVTGADGFIGYWLIRKLLRKNHYVIGVDNNLRGGRNLIPIQSKNYVTFDFDLCDFNNAEKIVEMADDDTTIFHLAAYNGTENFYQKPWDVIRNSSLPLTNILEALGNTDKRPKIIYTGSSESYSYSIQKNIGDVPTDETVLLSSGELLNPRWSYASAKTFGEYCLAAAKKQFDIDFLIARVHNIYGPRMGFNHFVSDVIKKVRSGKCCLPGASETRTFCYVTDAVEALLKLNELNPEEWNQVFHVGSTEEISIIDAAHVIANLMGACPDIIIPLASIPGSVKRRRPDITKLKTVTNFQPQVNFYDGVQKVIDWYSLEQIQLENGFR